MRVVYKESPFPETGCGGLLATYAVPYMSFMAASAPLQDRLAWLLQCCSMAPGLSRLRRLAPEARALAGKSIAGTCPVCGTVRVLFREFTANLRESGACSQCGASNRQRQMAYVLRTELGLPFVGRLTLPDRCRLFSAEANGPLHVALGDAPGYVCSDYWGEAYASGTSVNGIRHEDLEALSFDDNSIDVVLTSDVLEHVADAYRAHGEIFRRTSLGRSAHLHGAVRWHSSRRCACAASERPHRAPGRAVVSR